MRVAAAHFEGTVPEQFRNHGLTCSRASQPAGIGVSKAVENDALASVGYFYRMLDAVCIAKGITGVVKAKMVYGT